MASDLPTTINPSWLSWKDSTQINGEPGHFCLPYHCPCQPLKSNAPLQQITEYQGCTFVTRITAKLNEASAERIANAVESSEDGDEGDDYDLSNLFALPDDSSKDGEIGGFNPDDFLDWNCGSPKLPASTPKRLSDEILEKCFEIALSPEAGTGQITPKLTHPLMPFYSNENHTTPSPPQIIFPDLSHESSGPPTYTVPRHDPVAPIPRHGASSQPQTHPLQSMNRTYQSDIPSTHPAPLSQAVNTVRIQTQVSRLVGAYRPSPSLPTTRTSTPGQTRSERVSAQTQEFVQPTVAPPNFHVIPAAQRNQFGSMAHNLHHPPLTNTHPEGPEGFLRASLQHYNLPPQPSFQHQIPNFRPKTDFIGSSKENIQQPPQGGSPNHFRPTHGSGFPNGQVPKRRFEYTVASDPPFAAAEHYEPVKRQKTHHPIVQASESVFSLPLRAPTVSQPGANQPTFIVAPIATTSSLEAGRSNHMADMSNTLEAEKLPSYPRSECLGKYKRFMGSEYICAWNGCGDTLSIGQYQGNIDAFEQDVVAHLERHLPAEPDNDGRFQCQWFIKDSKNCSQAPKGLRGIIRHIYARHQDSKGTCSRCGKEFVRVEEYNKHFKTKCIDSIVSRSAKILKK